MTRARWFTISATVLPLTLLLGGTAAAQGSVDFRQFLGAPTPGARANAMGRAFVGVADDATAAVTNPAGLILLTRPQIYVETNSNFTDQRDVLGADEIRNEGLRFSAPFLAFSAPVTDRIAVGVSRHQFYAANFSAIGPTFGTVASEDRGTSYSGSISVSVLPDIKVGATLSGSKLTGFGVDDETALLLTTGALWQASEKISLGVSGAKSSDTFIVPNRFGAGVGLRPTPLALIAVDLSWNSDVETPELHAGGEYQMMSGDNRVFLRGGFYTSKAIDDQTFEDKTSVTGTLGAGVALGRSYQFDLAFLTRKEVVLSAAFRF